MATSRIVMQPLKYDYHDRKEVESINSNRQLIQSDTNAMIDKIACGELYEQDVEAILYTPIVPVKQSSIDKFEIEAIPGYSSIDVTCSFRISYDGVTYGQEYFNAISTADRYNSRYVARRLGFIDNYVTYKFRIVSQDIVYFD